MALEGSLSDFGLADILQLIYFQRKTGVLVLDGRMDKVRLFFIEGNIVGAESQRRYDDNRLGKILMKRGLVKEEDLRAALSEHEKTGVKLGNILATKGFVGSETVIEILTGQITETVIQLFSWQHGTYKFASHGVPADKDLPISLDTQHLLMEGLRIMDEWSLIKGKITLETVFRKIGGDPAGLTEEEQEILGYVGEENDVSTIIDLSSGDNFAVSKTLLSLLERGIIEVSEEKAPSAERREAVKEDRDMAGRLPNYATPAAIILSALLAFGIMFLHGGGTMKDLEAARSIERIRLSVEIYRIDHSLYPGKLDLVSSEKDPWGRPFIYRSSRDTFFLSSAGADGKEGTDDDIF
jgi:hypothetical protein